MAWLAFDRAVKSCEMFELEGPVEHWRGLRDAIRAEILARGYDHDAGTFTQSYDSRDLDAALLLLPLVGFIEPTDERMLRTIEAIERNLTRDGFVIRYVTDRTEDGLEGGEGVFLACSFWLADNLLLLRRREDAERLFERLLSIRNDVGLLAEEFDPAACRMLGNFPQALSHIGLVNTATNFQRSVVQRRET
jgi:GH15 family glucan-1,4-alpha-glucosidase